MRLIKPSFTILTDISSLDVYRLIELAGRTAYQSEGDSSPEYFINKKIMTPGHLSVIEHVSISVEAITDRGVSHEIVRHRLASYTQESTRFCNYTKGRFGGHITFIIPCFFPYLQEGEFEYTSPIHVPEYLGGAERIWFTSMMEAEHSYKRMIEEGCPAQQARSVLPNSLKTTIVMTMNLREWMHFFKMRTAPDAHPQMREIAIPLHEYFIKRYPVIFGVRE